MTCARRMRDVWAVRARHACGLGRVRRGSALAARTGPRGSGPGGGCVAMCASTGYSARLPLLLIGQSIISSSLRGPRLGCDPLSAGGARMGGPFGPSGHVGGVPTLCWGSLRHTQGLIQNPKRSSPWCCLGFMPPQPVDKKAEAKLQHAPALTTPAQQGRQSFQWTAGVQLGRWNRLIKH